jgi:hypothetical protein
MKQFLIDGIDSITHSYSYTIPTSSVVASWKLEGSILQLDKPVMFKYEEKCTLVINSSSGGFSTENTTWHLQNHNKEIASLYFFTRDPYYSQSVTWSVFPDTKGPWVIKKLTDSEFIIENISVQNKALRVVYEVGGL